MFFFLRPSHSLWCKSVYQLFPKSSGGGKDKDWVGADGHGSHILWLVNGLGLALLHPGNDNRSSPTACCLDGPISPVPGDCGPYIIQISSVHGFAKLKSNSAVIPIALTSHYLFISLGYILKYFCLIMINQ